MLRAKHPPHLFPGALSTSAPFAWACWKRVSSSVSLIITDRRTLPQWCIVQKCKTLEAEGLQKCSQRLTKQSHFVSAGRCTSYRTYLRLRVIVEEWGYLILRRKVQFTEMMSDCIGMVAFDFVVRNANPKLLSCVWNAKLELLSRVIIQEWWRLSLWLEMLNQNCYLVRTRTVILFDCTGMVVFKMLNQKCFFVWLYRIGGVWNAKLELLSC